ncbi:hypothetical protein CY34DRAFT_685856 [Suillus luteus UH-Slu-Lm8-n1]|uniref:Uncharacterized protein n=1 Tax=Suillus luteus UH-Slu-Lm8-n1 TaxID=930992 RepID=A0A0D0BKH5_9AGAM|nr:hypothetical protein CY34DRAFT_685856 [Suillus luteus UH-Slu-Lm8-n1]
MEQSSPTVVLHATINLTMCGFVRMSVKRHIRRNDRYVARVVVDIYTTMIQRTSSFEKKVCINLPDARTRRARPPRLLVPTFT